METSFQPPTEFTPGWRVVRPPLSRPFQMPDRSRLFSVFSGDTVALMVQAGSDNVEKVWVSLTACSDSQVWSGSLVSSPKQDYTHSVLPLDSVIQFHPYDVIRIRQNNKNSSEAAGEVITDSSEEMTNKITLKWYRNPQITVPSLVGVIGAAATVIAAIM